MWSKQTYWAFELSDYALVFLRQYQSGVLAWNTMVIVIELARNLVGKHGVRNTRHSKRAKAN